MIGQYRKKPVVIDAVQFDGENLHEVMAFCHGDSDGRTVQISTLEGVMTADVGDYVIRGVQGEYYPCKPGIFHQTYEQVG